MDIRTIDIRTMTATRRAFYFAYGSNMSPARLGARLGPVTVAGIAELPDHRLAFHKAGSDGSGKCDVPTCEHSCVLGVLYAVAVDDFAVLDRIEGVGAGYEREAVDLRVDDEVLVAHTYRATRIDPDLRPFDWYRHHVLAGALAAGLPQDYVAAIRAVDAVRDPDRARERRELAIYDGASTAP
jgi:hypothetical protein